MKPKLSLPSLPVLGRIAVGLLAAALFAVVTLNFATMAPETAAALSLPGPGTAITLGALIASLACLIAIGLLVRHNRTLDRLARTAETLAGGDFSVEVPACERSDTLGLLARAIALLKAHGEDWRSNSKQHRERAEALRLRLSCLEAALNQSEQGLAVVGHDLRLVFCNQRLLQGLNLPQGFATGGARLESLLNSVAAGGLLGQDEVRGQMRRWSELAKQRKAGRSAVALVGGGRLELRMKPEAGESMILLHRPQAAAAKPAVDDVREDKVEAEMAMAPKAPEPAAPPAPPKSEPLPEVAAAPRAVETKPLEVSPPEPKETFQRAPKAAEAAAPPRPLAGEPAPAATPGRGLRVLLVERDKSAQLQAITLLDKAGHWVDLTTSGQEAVKAVARRRYDAVLLDLELDDMTGFDFTRLVRRLGGEAEQIPIIALADSVARIADCLSVGMDDMLLRPLRADELQQKLSSCVASRQIEARAAVTQPAAAAAADCNRRGAPSLAQAQAEEWAELRSAMGGD